MEVTKQSGVKNNIMPCSSNWTRHTQTISYTIFQHDKRLIFVLNYICIRAGLRGRNEQIKDFVVVDTEKILKLQCPSMDKSLFD